MRQRRPFWDGCAPSARDLHVCRAKENRRYHQPTTQALTKTELFNADRFNWLDVAPVGEGGLLLTFLASAVDLELGVTKKLDELRDVALQELIKGGQVVERESDGQTYYWIAATPKMLEPAL